MWHKNGFLSLLFVAMTAMAGLRAEAAVLFSQNPVDGGMAPMANYSIADDSGIQNAESYLLPFASTVTGFRWWGTDVANNGEFIVRRFDTLLDLTPPDLAGTVVKTATALTDIGGNPIFQFDFTPAAPLSLGAGVGYVSIFNNQSDYDWFWLEGEPGDFMSVFRGTEGDVWTIDAPDLSLAVIGERTPTNNVVPEPGTAALLLLGAVAAWRSRRRS